jgi:hypothetical protein
MWDLASSFRNQSGGGSGWPTLPSPRGSVPAAPLPPPAPTAPAGPTSLSPSSGGLSLSNLTAIATDSAMLTAAARSGLQPPAFWTPAVLVSLIERPG